MGLLDLFFVASIPVLKVLLLTALGLCLALDRIDVLGENARKQLNTVVFFVFNPAIVSSNLAKTVTLESVVSLWFMPFNVLSTFLIGSALGWILVKITRPPRHLKGLVLGCCAAGNMGNLPLIIIPAVCKEKGSPFGAPDVCHKYGMEYASLSMAIGAIYLWSYVYNIVRIFSRSVNEKDNTAEFTSKMNPGGGTAEILHGSCSEELPLKNCSISVDYANKCMLPSEAKMKVPILYAIKNSLRMFARKINLRALFAPSTTGAMIGFIIGIVPQIRKFIIGGTAPLRVILDSASFLGEAAIPTLSLILGGNLLKGLKGSGVLQWLIIGIIAVRYIFLPLLGIVIVKSALRFGLVHSDPLYQFVLLLQYALPPAMNIGTITQLFGAGKSECSVIMLWTYGLASISLTLWSAFFMWLVA
ncbi:protein PIN-LIKES 3-like isoform X1 [Juglans microcarpa x Juglans regia]|uniref:protein PIN-LIKES 3-like isoform X1 n=2 Tax=Juglans microcarpa x Juglans regia TaxID=2249226 RepID=UPI001B7E2E78|nr:protein PIN-LIKES 3-like isoform X1 [Juglans microcarpa x Juglans regia]XP_041020125.1 protein PIN-LIKES 3-like isoform X1 [Juglans microcarpa x Juglans regia]